MNNARRDLCGGRSAMGVPTAIGAATGDSIDRTRRSGLETPLATCRGLYQRWGCNLLTVTIEAEGWRTEWQPN